MGARPNNDNGTYPGVRATKTPSDHKRTIPKVAINTPPHPQVPGPVKARIKETPMPRPSAAATSGRSRAEGGGSYGNGSGSRSEGRSSRGKSRRGGRY